MSAQTLEQLCCAYMPHTRLELQLGLFKFSIIHHIHLLFISKQSQCHSSGKTIMPAAILDHAPRRTGSRA